MESPEANYRQPLSDMVYFFAVALRFLMWASSAKTTSRDILGVFCRAKVMCRNFFKRSWAKFPTTPEIISEESDDSAFATTGLT